jgi:hypothetical protein
MSRKPKNNKQTIGAPVLHCLDPNAAGVDIGATEIAVPVHRDPQRVRHFSTLTEDLHAAPAWLPILVLLDGVYPNGPVMELCGRYHGQFLLQNDSLPSVWEGVQGLGQLQAQPSPGAELGQPQAAFAVGPPTIRVKTRPEKLEEAGMGNLCGGSTRKPCRAGNWSGRSPRLRNLRGSPKTCGSR